ncbi:hypothetical protein ACEQ6C_04495, partial [Rhizobium ruizarguesonis]
LLLAHPWKVDHRSGDSRQCGVRTPVTLEPQIGDRLACGVRVVLSRFKAFVEPDHESTSLKHGMAA